MLSYTHDTDLASIRVVASDMDATLLADDKTLPPNMADLVCALDAAGLTFAAASGRPLYTLKDLFASSLDRMAFISDNGAAVECRGQVIFKDLMDHATVRALLDLTFGQTSDIPTICGLDRCYIREQDRGYDAVFREFYHNIEYVGSLYDLVDAGTEFNKYTIYFPAGDARQKLVDVFGAAFGEELSVTCSGPVWIDIMNRGVTKGTGIARLAEHLGVGLADCAAFGDTDNDTQMLEAVGHSYLVANAEPRMREHARFEAPSNNDRGVAQVIERILAAQAR